MTLKEMSNRQFAFGFIDSEGNKVKPSNAFLRACINAGVEPTTRQASKYRNNKGIAYRFKQYQSIDMKRQVDLNKEAARIKE